MRKILYLLTLLCMVSCITEDSSVYKIDAITSSSTVNVDEDFTVTISSPDEMLKLDWWFDNSIITETNYNQWGIGRTKTYKFKCSDAGMHTIYFRATKKGWTASEIKKVKINVITVKAIKIVGFKLSSFDGMGTALDPEFPETDPNRLADIGITFVKGTTPGTVSLESQHGPEQYIAGVTGDWYNSEIKENEGDLKWNFETENLYIDPMQTFQIFIYDDDGIDNQDVTKYMSPQIPALKTYEGDKPSSVEFSYPEYNVAFTLFLEWPK